MTEIDEVEAKITIIIESGDRKQTITVPKASKVKFTSSATPDISAWPMNRTFLTDSVHMNLDFTALLDEEKGHLYLAENTTVARELPKTAEELHLMRSHPGYEYDTTEGQRKNWNDADEPPEGEGWERNVDAGRNGWDRFDYTEESYWRRKK